VSLPFAYYNNDFALTMYAQLRRGSGSPFFSPFAIRTALPTTYARARGETAAQMREAVQLTQPEPASTRFGPRRRRAPIGIPAPDRHT
jgi:serine protease inhibitor